MKYTNHHVSDLIVRLKNAIQRKYSNIEVPCVNIVSNVLSVLQESGYIEGFQKEDQAYNVQLRYVENTSSIQEIYVVSKPSKRCYVKRNNIPVYYNGLGTVILSTSKGIMTGHEATNMGVGGEVICKVF